MISALNIKNIDPKAMQAKGSALDEAVALDPETMLEGADFANELAASLSGEEAGLKVKAVKVSPEQMMEIPSKLNQGPAMQPSETQTEGINPKIFDPALTNGVGDIIQPATTAVPSNSMPSLQTPVQLSNEQVLKLAQAQGPAVNAEVEGEVAQAMLKSPQLQVAGGRSPAIDLAQSEIDPQLMNMEDFVAQKNLATKKSINNASAYGMPMKGHSGKTGIDTGLTQSQVVSEIGAGESGAGMGSMNSQQFILNSQIDVGSNAQMNEVQAPVKTFNLSNIKTDSPDQIMTQITDYIAQSKTAKEPTVMMRMNHDELGMIDITVNKMARGNDAISVNIGTHSTDGKNFFQANSKDLFTHLTNSGLNVSDLKVETPSHTAKNEFDFGGQNGRGGSQDKQFGSEQNQRRHDSERRQNLWDRLKDKEAA